MEALLISILAPIAGASFYALSQTASAYSPGSRLEGALLCCAMGAFALTMLAAAFNLWMLVKPGVCS